MGKCKLSVGTVQGEHRAYPFSRDGWAAAVRDAKSIASGSGKWLALVDAVCPGGRIPLYQCGQKHDGKGVYCGIESVGDPEKAKGSIAIAGLRGARKRRRRK